jgi:ribosomal protein L29
MTKKKLFLVLLAGLLLCNIILLAVMLSNDPPPKHGPRAVVIERLHLDKDQIVSYDELIVVHRKKVLEKEEALKALKNELFNLLSEKHNDNAPDSLASQIGKTQTDIEQIHYSHFLEIKQLCVEEQMDEFHELVKELAGLFRPLPKKKAKK